MGEYSDEIKKRVLAYIERKNDIVAENAIQTSLNVGGKALRLVEVLPAIERLIAENKIERCGHKMYRLRREPNKIITGKWV